MNPSDRLKVVKATSPSIRVSAAPQQNINVAKPGQNSQTLNVSGAAYKPTPQKSPDFLGGIAHGVGDFGAHIVSGLQQAGGNIADIGLQGSAVVNEIGRNLNPFINDQQRDAQRVADVRNIEAARNAIKATKTINGESLNPYADYKPTGDIGKDFGQLAGRGLQTGLDATAFINPARVGAKALFEPGLKTAAKDIIGSSLGLGLAQGLATGSTVYGQTGDMNKALSEGAGSGAVAAASQGVLGTFGHVVGNLLSKVGSPAQKIARSTNAKSIDGQLAKLHPEIPDFERQVLSETLAGIKDKKRVQEILTSLDAAKEKIPVEKVLERGTETPAVNDNGTALDRKKAAEAEAQQLAQQAADAKQAQTDATLAPAKDPNSIDYPTFQAQKDFEAFAAKENEKLNALLNNNPDLTPQQIEAAKQAAADHIKKTFDEMQAARAKSVEAEQATPQPAPDNASVEQAAKLQSGTVSQTVNGDGTTTPKTPDSSKSSSVADAQNGVAPLKQDETPTNSPADGNTRTAVNKVFTRDDEFDRGTPLLYSNAKEEDLIDALGELRSKPVNERSSTDLKRIKNIEEELKSRRDNPTSSSEISKGEKPKNSVADTKTGSTSSEDLATLMKSVDDAEAAAKGKVSKVSQEKAKRISAAREAYNAAGGGEAGIRAKLAQLRGAYEEADYTPISVDKDVQDRFLNQIESSNLQEFEKLNTQNALRKVWGANPEKPTKSDVNYIRQFFNNNYGEGVGDEIARGIEESAAKGEAPGDLVANLSGLPRALMATGDLSGGFRQALPLGTRYPKLWANANKESVKYALNPEYYQAEMKKIADSPEHNVIADKMGVDLTGVGATQDEAFINAGLAEKIPVGGIAVKAADRAYTGVITRLRYDVAKKIVDEFGGAEQFVKNMEATYGDQMVNKTLFGLTQGKIAKSERAMRALGEVINTFTGRGGMKGGALDKHMKTASTLLFAPRLWAANLNRLNPAWYARLAVANPKAAKLALQSQGTFFATAGIVLGLAAAAGAEVGMDPRSADFGKIKVGNTRYDILGGQLQNIVFLSRLATGEKVNSESGDVQKLGETFGGATALSLAQDMFENKSNPLLGFGMKLLQTSEGDNPLVRKDEYGNDFNLADKIARLFIPLGAQGAFDTSVDDGNIPLGVAMNAPSFFGVGVQTYGNSPSDLGKANNGNADVLAAGKKFDAETKKRQAEYKKTLSKDDREMVSWGEDKLNKMVQDGVLTQEKVDDILRKKKTLDSVAKGNKYDVPEGVKDPLAVQYYQKYNSMSKKDQEYWLSDKNPPDDFAKEITKQMNESRVAGLSEFKPSNALAKLYADYQKDLETSKDLTELDKVNKAKSFQSDAAKLNLNPNARDIYTEGSSKDLKKLIGSNGITKTDLEAAIQLDNELYTSGLSGSLKFSKKFRNSMGYATPPDPDGTGGSGGSGSTSAHLNDFILPSSIGSAKSGIPTFSAKARTTKKLSVNSNLPGKATKKISIKL